MAKEKNFQERTTAHLMRARDQLMEKEHQAEDYIRAHPMKSIGIAAGVGFAVGAALAWRR